MRIYLFSFPDMQWQKQQKLRRVNITKKWRNQRRICWRDWLREIFGYSSDVLKQSNATRLFYVFSFYLPTNDIEITKYMSFAWADTGYNMGIRGDEDTVKVYLEKMADVLSNNE